MSCEAPVTLKSMANRVTIKIDFLSVRTVLVLQAGKEKEDIFFSLGAVFLSNISTVGKTTKKIINEKLIPALIIHPKLIIG